MVYRLSLDQQQMARAEGWKLVCGYPAPTYSKDSPFLSPFSVLQYIVNKAAVSEWHRELYLSLPWTIADAGMLKARCGVQIGFLNGNTAVGRGVGPPASVMELLTERSVAGDVVATKAISEVARRQLLAGTFL